MSVLGWESYCLGGVVVLEKLLDKINVGHDHAAAAVSLQTELVHSVTGYVCQPLFDCALGFAVPIGLSGICDQLKVSLPKVTSDLNN